MYYSVLPSFLYSVLFPVLFPVLYSVYSSTHLCSFPFSTPSSVHSLFTALFSSLLSSLSLLLSLLPCPMPTAAAQFVLLLLLSPFAAFNCRQFVCFAAVVFHLGYLQYTNILYRIYIQYFFNIAFHFYMLYCCGWVHCRWRCHLRSV